MAQRQSAWAKECSKQCKKAIFRITKNILEWQQIRVYIIFSDIKVRSEEDCEDWETCLLRQLCFGFSMQLNVSENVFCP